MNFQALSYRIYFAARDLGVGGIVRRWPRAAREINRLVNSVLPETPAWVQIRSGLSQGIWMRLHLPGEACLWRGENELSIQAFILAVVRPGAIFYDIGAHAGSIALGVARLVRPLGRVVAFEADPENVESLRENGSRNHLAASVQVVPAAVWSYTATAIPFRRGGTRRSHGGVESDGQHPVLGSGEVINVSAVALDDFIADRGPIPQLVKIDVEGGEYEVLRGGKALFTNQRPIIIVEVHHQQAAEKIDAWLGEHQYCAQWNIPKENFPRCLFAWPKESGGAWTQDLGRIQRSL